MKKEFLKIGIALVVLLGLAIPLSLHREKKMKQQEGADQSEKFVDFDFSTIQKMVIKNQSGEVELERRKKDATGNFQDEFETRNFEFKTKPQWLVVKPYRALADEMFVESFTSQIKELGYEKVVQDTKDQAKDYDLDPSLFSVQFYDSNLEPKLTLNMGSENPAQTSFYFSASSKPGIYLGPRILQPYKDQEAQEWREKKVIGFSSLTDVEKISVRHSNQKDQSFETTKDKAIWKIGPVSDNLAADPTVITQFVAHLDAMRARKILDEPTLVRNMKELGEVTINIKDRKNPVVYKVFAGEKNSQAYYVQRSDLKNVFMISEDSKVLPTFQSVVSKKLIKKSYTDITSIKTTLSNAIIEIVKEKDEWKIKKPFEDSANPRRIQSIMQVLEETKPTIFLKDKTLNARDQKLKIELGLNDQSMNAVTFYQEGKKFFAKIEDETQPRVVELSQIPTELYDHVGRMRNDDLIPVSKENVQRIMFTKGEARIEIELGTKKKKTWFLKVLENVPATVSMKWKEQLTPEEFFNRISEMYLAGFVTSPDPAMKYEMGTLDIFTVQDKQYTWKFGEKQGQMINVYSPDRNTVGRMPYSRYQDLMVFVEESKDKPAAK